jgi:hypothetical protein
VVVTQGGRLRAFYQLRQLIPNRSHAIPSGWRGGLRPDEDVLISVGSRLKWQGYGGQAETGGP